MFSFRCPESSAESDEAPSSGLTATFSPEAGEKGQVEDAQDIRIEHGHQAGWLSPIAEAPKRQAVREKK